MASDTSSDDWCMNLRFDATIADIWEDGCKALINGFEEGDRLIAIQADDLLAMIYEWRYPLEDRP